MENIHNTEPIFVPIGGIQIDNTDIGPNLPVGTTLGATVQVWSDTLLLIPHLRNSRQPTHNAAIRRAINSTIFHLSFSVVEGFLWDFIETAIYKLKLDNINNSVLSRILDDYLYRKEDSWQFESKVNLIKVLVNFDMTTMASLEAINLLKNLRNIFAHGGEVKISLNNQNSEFYLFDKKVCTNVLMKAGKINQQNKDNLTTDYLDLLFSDEVCDFYFEKVKSFLIELNAKQIDEQHKDYIITHTLNF